MFVKYADAQVLDTSYRKRRTAAANHLGSFDYDRNTDGNYLYVAARACTADVPNLNYDMLPSYELETAYQTFVGCPIYLNHDNTDPSKARGVIIDAKWHDEDPEDKWIEILAELDEDRAPKMCQLIKSGEIDTFSMGLTCDQTVCSICGNVSEDAFDQCEHIRNKGSHYGNKLAYEICEGIEFFEESVVFDPADRNAVTVGIDDGSKKTAMIWFM